MAHPCPIVFQSPEMYDFFITTRSFIPEVIIACNDDESICGVLLAVIIREKKWPVSYFSSRTVVYGGPLIDHERKDSNDILDSLLKALIQKVSEQSVFIQFRNFSDWSTYKDVFARNGFIFTDRLNLIVDTTDEKQMMLRMSKSKVRQVHQALKNGAEIVFPRSIDDIRELYGILYRLYRFRVKKPLPDWPFFENFYYGFNSGKSGIILLISYKGKIIGGILSPVTAGRTIYEWYVCGLDEDYKKLYPSVLATWAAMDYAVKNNIPSFDFMGVGRPEKKYGVRDFKQKFGGNMVNYGRWSRINNKFLYTVAEVGYNLLTWIKSI